jgi:hypothetical protein
VKAKDEADMLVAICAIFTKLPIDAKFRTLAFLTASTLKVGTDPISEALYEKAREARERRRRPRKVVPTGSEVKDG